MRYKKKVHNKPEKPEDPMIQEAFRQQPLYLGVGNQLYPGRICKTHEEWEERMSKVKSRADRMFDEAYPDIQTAGPVGEIDVLTHGGYVYVYVTSSHGRKDLELCAREDICGDISGYYPRPWRNTVRAD